MIQVRKLNVVLHKQQQFCFWLKIKSRVGEHLANQTAEGGGGCNHVSVAEHAARDVCLFILYGSQQLCDILSHNVGCKAENLIFYIYK